ncbi:hypothetical protein AAVH_41358, partial [Aphelenchoides avenae]
MLINEVLVDVLHWLDRHNLDTVELTTRLLSSSVVASFNDYPLRSVRFTVHSGETVAFESDISQQTIGLTATFGSMGSMFRRTLVREVRFECLFDEVVFAALLPYAGYF